MGSFELNGKNYDGLVPMPPFGGMLKDDEVGALLTYVRNDFGNKAPPILPAHVSQAGQSFYLAEELLKGHPLKLPGITRSAPALIDLITDDESCRTATLLGNPCLLPLVGLRIPRPHGLIKRSNQWL